MPDSTAEQGPMRIGLEDLRAFTVDVFATLGLAAEDAAIVADCLVGADLRGVYSHGVIRIPIYAERLRRGLFNAKPNIEVTRLSASAARVDGDNGMGAVVGTRAIDEAMALAQSAGIGVVSAVHSNHYGIASFYTQRAVERGYIAISCSNAPPTTAPFGGGAASIGTNPFAIAAPAGAHPALMLDMSSSVVARGKIIAAAQANEPIPEGWALDKHGRPTTDAAAALEGAVLTFGGPKGSGIAVFVEILAAVLAGANITHQLPDFYRNLTDVPNLGQFFLAIDVARFMPGESFRAKMDELVDSLKACPPAAGHDEVLMPGEIEARLEAERKRDGIPLSAEILASLREAGAQAGVPFPEAALQPVG